MKQRRRMGSLQARLLPIQEIVGSLICLAPPGQPGLRQYCSILEVSGVQVGLLSDEHQRDLFHGYQALCRGLSFPTQTCLHITPLDLETYLEHVQLPAPEKDQPTAMWQQLALSHTRFVREMTADAMLLERRFYLVIPAEQQQVHERWPSWLHRRARRQQEALTRTQAQEQIQARVTVLRTQLSSLGLHVQLLHDDDLVRLYDGCFGTDRARRFPLPPSIVDGATPIQDLLAPAALRIERDHLVIDEQEYLCALAVRGLPRTVRAGWLEPLVLCDETMEIILQQCPRPRVGAVHLLRRKQAQFDSAVSFGQKTGNRPHPQAHLASRDLGPLVEQVAAGDESLHDCSFHLLIRARSKDELERRVRRVSEQVYATCHHRPSCLYFEQEQGMQLALPGSFKLRDTLLLESSSLATLFPFFSNVLYRPSPRAILEGITPQREPVVIDPWELLNYNRLLVAPSGSGKSYKVKTDLSRTYVTYQAQAKRAGRTEATFQILVLDPEREYRRLCEELEGHHVHIAPGSRHHINIFDLPVPGAQQRQAATLKEDVLATHIQRLHYYLDLMLAQHNLDDPAAATLTAEEKSLLDLALYEIYRRVGITPDEATHQRTPPLLRDLYHVLESGDVGPDPTGLAQRLRRFVYGSLSGLFNSPTDVELDNPLAVFDVKDLDGELRPLGLMMLTTLIWNRTFASTIPRWLVIDELATLFRYPSGARFCEELFQRSRKMYLSVTGITQSPGLLRDSSILTNCAVHILLRQDQTTSSDVDALFRLSKQESQLLRSIPRGEGLMLVEGKRMHVRFVASPQEHALATTEPRELASREERHPTEQEETHV